MLEVTILSAQELIFTGRASHVILPGEAGVFEVGSFHRTVVSRLLPGLILIDDQCVPIQRGVVKVARDTITAIVEPDRSHAEGGPASSGSSPAP